ncbi:cytochrome P450 [Anaerobacillus alkaliphilus]|uniref:Cytochrome P450 n=1 Tax=Anaerobacillus alkaliphilus TaxID=1548597 RepID=A0A4Q0VT14_9BACI|nr:cytochrome P450 [Anaerobacillus alkaliphilus]RXJ00656.1 cytochrome P450 [Anaerobacillus alkaliphilus]
MVNHTNELGPLNTMGAEFQKNRYAELKKYQEISPVHPEAVQALGGRPFTQWTVTRYADVLTVLKDARFVKEIRKIISQDQQVPVPPPLEDLVKTQRNQMLFRDPPDHTRLRRLVNQAFTPKIVQRLKPTIQRISTRLLDEMEGKSEIDIVKDYAYPLPVIVIADLLGVPREDHSIFKEWSDGFIKTIDIAPTMEDLVTGNRVTIEFRDYFRQIVQQRAETPQDDLISGLIQAKDTAGKLSEDELLDMCILLLVAGHETTVNLIANSMLLLLLHKNQQVLLRENPELLDLAIEEVLRFEPPVQATSRFVSEDMVFQGREFKKGDSVTVWLSAANRDPSQFGDPEMFDITRKENPHLAFGLGNHFCLGAPLAREEGTTAIQSFLEKFSHIELVSEDIQWKPSPLMRSLKSLPVQVRR